MSTGCLLGVCGKDFIMIAAEKNLNQNFITLNDETKPIYQLSKNLIIGATGNQSDTAKNIEYAQRAIKINNMNNHEELSTFAIVSYIRQVLTDNKNFETNYLVGGLCNGPEIYIIDGMGSYVKVNYAAFGLPGTLCLGLLDRFYKSGLSQEEAYKLLKQCEEEIQKRCLLKCDLQYHILGEDGLELMNSI